MLFHFPELHRVMTTSFPHSQFELCELDLDRGDTDCKLSSCHIFNVGAT